MHLSEVQVRPSCSLIGFAGCNISTSCLLGFGFERRRYVARIIQKLKNGYGLIRLDLEELTFGIDALWSKGPMQSLLDFVRIGDATGELEFEREWDAGRVELGNPLVCKRAP